MVHLVIPACYFLFLVYILLVSALKLFINRLFRKVLIHLLLQI